jgi:ABC-2 type transport system ATP-binding protein
MSSAVIAVENLTKTFPGKNRLRFPKFGRGSGTEVLRSVNLQVFAGEIVGLVGPNGAGKTTLLEILATLLLPTGGHARICGYDVVRETTQVKRVIGYCPSGSQSFYPRVSGANNLEFFALVNDFQPREAKDRVRGILGLVGIDGMRHVAFHRYSEGVKQRLGLARALLTDPPVLLLDEPTRSLDPIGQREFRRFLRVTLVEKLGKAVLLVTHSLAEAEEVCGRLAILDRGRIARVGTPAELKAAVGSDDLGAAFEEAVGTGD